MNPNPLVELKNFTVPVGMESLQIASPRTNACEASNYPWEKPEAAPKACRGLTQIEFDVANMRVTGVVDKGMAKILLSIQAPVLRNARIGSTTIYSRRS